MLFLFACTPWYLECPSSKVPGGMTFVEGWQVATPQSVPYVSRLNMSAQISFFPVDNGDMTLIEFESGNRLLIDVNIRADADDPDEDVPDVATMLRERLDTDDKGRLYVDAFLLSHPDEDHCRGLETHFHLGDPDDWKKSDDKILIREMWSSPIVFRRKDRAGSGLCKDAEAWWAEARRRVKKHKNGAGDNDGDRILILGEDVDGKTDGLEEILISVDEEFNNISGELDSSMMARLLGPLPKQDSEYDEKALEKNRSSVIVRFQIEADANEDACRYLTGGDAEVAIWERIWDKHQEQVGWIDYDILQTPHHCSWHCLSHDSWSEADNPAVSDDARSALSQTRDGAYLVASSKPIKDDDSDPPCIGAKREYESIASDADGEFICVMEEIDKDDPEPIVFEIDENGPDRAGPTNKSGPIGPSNFTKSGGDPDKPVQRDKGRRYA